MMKQRVSVILPNFNHANVVGRAIASILAQTHPVYELLIIDDASTDESLKQISAALDTAPKGLNIRVLENANNRGVVETLNRGINEATGDFLLLGAADDWYGPEMLERLLGGGLAYPEAALLCGNPVEVDIKTGEEVRRPLPFGNSTRYLDPGTLVKEAQRQNFLFSTGGCLLRRDAVMTAGGLQPDFRWHCDWLLNFTIAFRHGVYFTPYDTLFMTVGDETYSTGRHAPSDQRCVISAIIDSIVTKFPDVTTSFRSAALLPTYEPDTIITLVRKASRHGYLSPLLIWRLLTYKAMRLAGRILSPASRHHLRRIFRV